jgi:hypothetical protein
LGLIGRFGQHFGYLGAIDSQDQLPDLDLPGPSLIVAGNTAEVDRFQQAAAGAGRLQ